MKELADETEAAGDIIGHIKAYISGDRQGAMLSTTGGEVSIRPSTPYEITVNFVAIVFVQDEAGFIKKVAAVQEKF